MFTALQLSIMHSLSKQPVPREELSEEIAEKQGKTVRGVNCMITQLRNYDALKENEGIMTITPLGLKSLETQSDEYELTSRFRRL